MAIKALSLVWITVSNLEKAEKFFSQSVGLTLKVADKEHGWLEFTGSQGGFRLGVTGSQEDSCCGQSEQEKCCRPQGTGTNAVVTMEVDDIVASKKELESKGVIFSGPIMELPDHIKLASFSDPDGNQFQLVEVLSKK